MRFLLANYLKQLNDTADGGVGHLEIDAMFPNSWHAVYIGNRPYKKPTALLSLFGLHDIPRSHIDYQTLCWKKSPVLHLYRNPLDFAVCLYFFKYEYETHLAGTVSGPCEVLEKELVKFGKMYISYREAAKNTKNNLLSISYEDLARYPEVCLAITLRWLGLEPDPQKIAASIRYSSEHITLLTGAGERWQRDGTTPANPEKIEEYTKMCIREGSIGQWKKYFSSSYVKQVEKKLAGVGVDLYDFTLE